MKKLKPFILLLLIVAGLSQTAYALSDAAKAYILKADSLVSKADETMLKALGSGDLGTYKKAVEYCEQAIKTFDEGKAKLPQDSGAMSSIEGLVKDLRKSYFSQSDFAGDAKGAHNKAVKYNGSKYKVTVLGKSNLETMLIYEKGIHDLMKGLGAKR